MTTEMTLGELRAFIASAPFRHVRDATHGNPDSKMDPHEYVIASWDKIDREQFDRFVATIRAQGYLGRYVARYRPERPMTNRYLVIDDRVYWFIPPMQLCRTKVEFRQHEPVEEQLTIEEATR